VSSKIDGYNALYIFLPNIYTMNIDCSLNDVIRNIVKEENNLLLNKIEEVLCNSKILEKNNKPLTFDEALEYLGCSRSYLYKLTSNKIIPHAKSGKRLIFEKISLDQFLLKNKVKSIIEIQEDADLYLNSIFEKSKI
jgi:excisionase family DNA binding protein